MIYGIGTDLCKISRVEKALKKQGTRFTERLLTAKERENLPHPTASQLAKRWAAKEAVSKALGVGIGEQLSFQDIHISHLESGQPLLAVTAEAFSDLNYHLSLSDEDSYALAFVVAEKA